MKKNHTKATLVFKKANVVELNTAQMTAVQGGTNTIVLPSIIVLTPIYATICEAEK